MQGERRNRLAPGVGSPQVKRLGLWAWPQRGEEDSQEESVNTELDRKFGLGREIRKVVWN